MINVANFDSLFPMIANVVSIPFEGMTREGCEVFGEVMEKYPEIIEKEIEGNGLHLLSYNMTPAINLYLNSDTPVTSPADIAGKKIIGPSALMLKVIEACGAAPLQVAYPDLFQSMQGGVADGLFQNEGVIVSNGIYDVANQNVLFQEDGGIYFDIAIHCVSAEFWNSLSPAAQQIITEEAAVLHTEEQINRFSDMDRFKDVVGATDNMFTILTPEQIETWKEAAKDVIDEKIEEITSLEGCEIFREAYEYGLSIMK